MQERSWRIIPREEDKLGNGIYFKHLDLLTPYKASSEHGLSVESPVLVCHSGISENGLVYKRAGEVIEAPKFSPGNWEGIYFEHTNAGILMGCNETAFDVQEKSWVAFLEAIGDVYVTGRMDDRLAGAVRIERIEAHCSFCARDNFWEKTAEKIKLPYKPLNEGFAYDKFRGLNGEGILGAICDVEKHIKKYPSVESTVRYRFQISEQGEFLTSSL